MSVNLLSKVLLLCMLTTASSNVLRDFTDDICDPHTVTSGHYPSLLKSLTIQKTSPIKLKATYRLPNSTKEFSFEGMVLSTGFSAAAGLAACRSLGCSKALGWTPLIWTTGPNCEFTCPDGTSAKQTCRYMIRNFQCANDAINLLECLTDENFWKYASNTPGSTYPGVDLKCAGCED